jgi:hypothetical protein
MHHKGQEGAFRKLIWIEAKSAGGWGCPQCAWMFHPSESPAGTFDELTDNIQRQLDEGFASHDCGKHPAIKGSSA